MVMPVGAFVFRGVALGSGGISYLKGVLKKRGYNTAVGDEEDLPPR